jgi:hypothetical protein
MIKVFPRWITRVARCFVCGALAFANNAALADKATDLSGYWAFDAARSELKIDASALSPKAQERLRLFDPLKHDPTLLCMPYGMPRVMSASGASPMEIIQTDSQVTLLFDAHDEVRRVFLNTAREQGELAPLWLGYAHGKWERGTLVVETLGLTDQSLIDATGVPHSDQLRVVERIQRIDADTLVDEMTLHDLAAFTKPIMRKLYFKRTVVGQQREFHCAERQWLDHVMGRAKELSRAINEKQQGSRP